MITRLFLSGGNGSWCRFSGSAASQDVAPFCKFLMASGWVEAVHAVVEPADFVAVGPAVVVVFVALGVGIGSPGVAARPLLEVLDGRHCLR